MKLLCLIAFLEMLFVVLATIIGDYKDKHDKETKNKY